MQRLILLQCKAKQAYYRVGWDWVWGNLHAREQSQPRDMTGSLGGVEDILWEDLRRTATVLTRLVIRGEIFAKDKRGCLR